MYLCTISGVLFCFFLNCCQNKDYIGIIKQAYLTIRLTIQVNGSEHL